jgi:hypothetical protein
VLQLETYLSLVQILPSAFRILIFQIDICLYLLKVDPTLFLLKSDLQFGTYQDLVFQLLNFFGFAALIQQIPGFNERFELLKRTCFCLSNDKTSCCFSFSQVERSFSIILVNVSFQNFKQVMLVDTSFKASVSATLC